MCLYPLHLKSGDIVPCSRCSECRARRISAWSIRLIQQDKVSISSHFITLTYGQGTDQEGIYPRRSANNLATISKRDLQLFFKRLRGFQLRRHVGLPVKYYAAGEYGSNTQRPHYHAIVYNCQPDDINAAWHLGSVHYGDVKEASVGYCLKYISKGHTVPRHSRDDRVREFSLMSKGLGANYLTPEMKAWHQADPTERLYATIEDGKKISLPRYYKDKIFSEEDRARIKKYYEWKNQLEAEICYDPAEKKARIAQIEQRAKNQSVTGEII